MEEPLLPFTPTPGEEAKPDVFTKYRYPILAVLLLGLGFGTYLTLTPPDSVLSGENVLLADEAGENENLETAVPTDEIVVDIAGAVVTPGVYYLPTASIVETAIEASGGFSPQVDMDAVFKNINRAGELANHSKIYIPKKGDINIVYTNASATNFSDTTVININSATNAQLESLPGIGEVLAQRIIDYRLQNGGFKATQELKDVPGISDAKFSQLEGLIGV